MTSPLHRISQSPLVFFLLLEAEITDDFLLLLCVHHTVCIFADAMVLQERNLSFDISNYSQKI